MGTTRKVLRKVACIVESSAGSYLAPDTLLPMTSFTVQRTHDMIADESIIGQSFQDLPLQGTRKIGGELAGQFDVLSCIPILEAAFGANATKVFTLPTTANAKSLSICALDDVKTNKFAGCYIRRFTLSSKAEGALEWSADIVGYVPDVRDDTEFPSVSVNPGTRLRHFDASGTGYMRIGDQADALASGDNMGLSSVELEINWNHEHQFDNTDQDSLIPLSGAGGRPSVSLKLGVARHSADTFLAWRDALTALQAEFYWYLSATASLKIEIPNFVLSAASVGGDDVPGIDVECMVARNGIGASYSNSNMTFNSPVRATVDNA